MVPGSMLAGRKKWSRVPHACARLAVFAVLAGLWLAPPSLAFAQVSAAAGEVEELLRKSNDLRRSGYDQGALPLLQKAYSLDPSPRTAVQLGLVEQALGRWADADLHLATGLLAKDDGWIKRNRSVIEEALSRVKMNVGRVEVTGEPAGAEVLVGGRPVGKVPLKEAVAVSAGTVDVELRAAGYQPALRTLTIAGGQYQPVVIRLQREALGRVAMAGGDVATDPTGDLAARADSPTSGRTWAGRILLAGAAVGAGVGIYAVIDRYRGVDAFNTRRCIETPRGDIVLQSGERDGKCESLAADYKGATTLAIVGFAAAAALGGTAVILKLTEAPSSESVAWRPRCTLDWMTRGLSCAGRF